MGKDARLFIFLFMSCQVWDLQLQWWCWTPVLMSLSPLLGGVPSSCPHPQLPLAPQEPGWRGLGGLTQGLIKFHSLHWVTVLTVQDPN